MGAPDVQERFLPRPSVKQHELGFAEYLGSQIKGVCSVCVCEKTKKMPCACCDFDREKYANMSHEERQKEAAKHKDGGMGMVVAGFGTMGGLIGALWGSIGA